MISIKFIMISVKFIMISIKFTVTDQFKSMISDKSRFMISADLLISGRVELIISCKLVECDPPAPPPFLIVEKRKRLFSENLCVLPSRL